MTMVANAALLREAAVITESGVNGRGFAVSLIP